MSQVYNVIYLHPDFEHISLTSTMQQTKILDLGYDVKNHVHSEKMLSTSDGQKHKKFVAPVHLDINKFYRQKTLYFFAKRAFDITLSALVVIFILSWLTPLLAILIKIDSRGPVFFLQKRVGYLGKIFYCYKFRSMTLNKEADFKQATEYDYRITRLGKILRKSNLDELPQFINVLLGDMSIVGPRPHMLYDCLCFSYHIEGYKTRNIVRPGITGLAQIKGYRGVIQTRNCMTNRFVWDLLYIKNASFYLDLQIIRLTARQTLNGLFEKISTLFSSRKDRKRLVKRRTLKTLQKQKRA